MLLWIGEKYHDDCTGYEKALLCPSTAHAENWAGVEAYNEKKYLTAGYFYVGF